MLDKEEKYKRLIFLPVVLIITSLYIIGFNAVNRGQQEDNNQIVNVDVTMAYSNEKEKTNAQEENEEGPEILQQIDINSATVDVLMTLPGIGKKKAQAIVDLRTEMRGFRSVDEIVYVPGIGVKTLENIKKYIVALPYEKNEER